MSSLLEQSHSQENWTFQEVVYVCDNEKNCILSLQLSLKITYQRNPQSLMSTMVAFLCLCSKKPQNYNAFYTPRWLGLGFIKVYPIDDKIFEFSYLQFYSYLFFGRNLSSVHPNNYALSMQQTADMFEVSCTTSFNLKHKLTSYSSTQCDVS